MHVYCTHTPPSDRTQTSASSVWTRASGTWAVTPTDTAHMNYPISTQQTQTNLPPEYARPDSLALIWLGAVYVLRKINIYYFKEVSVLAITNNWGVWHWTHILQLNSFCLPQHIVSPTLFPAVWCHRGSVMHPRHHASPQMYWWVVKTVCLPSCILDHTSLCNTMLTHYHYANTLSLC